MELTKTTLETYNFYDLLSLVEDEQLQENIQTILGDYSTKFDDNDIVLVNGWKVYESFSGTLQDLPQYEELLKQLEFLGENGVLVSY